jgi:hypothetical protein
MLSLIMLVTEETFLPAIAIVPFGALNSLELPQTISEPP